MDCTNVEPLSANAQRLAGKRVLVSGSSNGIGACIARTFFLHGARVAGYDRAAQSAEGRCELSASGDVADAAAVAAFVVDAARQFGGIDILVNAAGIDVFSDPLQLDQDTWWRNLAVNVGGAWNFSQAVLPHLLAGAGGAIVNIASVHGHKIIPGAFPYPVAKHALVGLTKALALEYAARGVRCNSISPGLILTERIERWFASQPDPEAMRRQQTELLPGKRIGTPGEVAMTALFLASDEARFINGTDVLIDGGRSQLYHE